MKNLWNESRVIVPPVRPLETVKGDDLEPFISCSHCKTMTEISAKAVRMLKALSDCASEAL